MIRRSQLTDLAVVVVAIAVDTVAWDGERSLRSGALIPLGVVPVVIALVHVTLMWRRTHPRVVFAVEWTFALVSLVMPQFQPFAGLLVAVHAVAARFPATTSAPMAAATLLPFAVHSYSSASAGRTTADPSDLIQLMVLWSGMTAAAWGVGRLAFVASARSWRLREARAREAVAEERTRLAHELHDTISHAVTTMMIQAAGGRAQLGRDEAQVRAALEVIEQSGLGAMVELHRMLGLLAGGETSEPTVADITVLVTQARGEGRQVNLTESGAAQRLRPEIQVAAYRIVQESLTNSMKYAGPQAVVGVDLSWTEAALEIEVTDRTGGSRLAPEHVIVMSSGHGLRGLRARVETFGGTLVAGPIDGGYRVSARLPAANAQPGRSLLRPDPMPR